MKLSEEFREYEIMWDTLLESKADHQRLARYAGADLADRFWIIRNKLKGQAKDSSFWIGKIARDGQHAVTELEQTVATAETTKSKTQLKKETTDAGAELVATSDYWNVYHITTLDASKIYGRDTMWCISGETTGEQAWKKHTYLGADFYFFIVKNKALYDAGGEESKFAVEVFKKDKNYRVYNQKDIYQELGIDAIPYADEVVIPGINFDTLSIRPDEAEEDEAHATYFCSECDKEIYDGTHRISPEGDSLCAACFNTKYAKCDSCQEIFYLEDVCENVYGELLCDKCNEKYQLSRRSFVEAFVELATVFEAGDIEMYDEEELIEMITAWNSAKAAHALRFTEAELASIEKQFVENAAYDGIEVNLETLAIAA